MNRTSPSTITRTARPIISAPSNGVLRLRDLNSLARTVQRTVGVDDRDVGVGADLERALGQSEDAGRVDRQLLDGLAAKSGDCGSIRYLMTSDSVVSRLTMPKGARSSSCSFFSEARGAWQLVITSIVSSARPAMQASTWFLRAQRRIDLAVRVERAQRVVGQA